MNEPLLFGVMSDCQYADADDSTAIVPGSHHRYDNRYRMGIEKLKEAVDVFNRHELAFVIHLGDFIDRHLEDADVLSPITNALKAPLLHVLGNHDFTGSEGDVPRVLAKFGLDNSFYSTVINGYRLIVLDTNKLGVIEHAKGSEEYERGIRAIDALKRQHMVQAYEWNGGIGDEQLRWLDDELTLAGSNGERAIIFSHHPVFPPGPLNALDDTAIIDAIEKHPGVVMAYMNGHNHMGGYGEYHDTPYITVPGMLQGETNAFGVVSVDDTRLQVDGYGHMQDMLITRS